jgi:hypothetical protein
MQPVIDSLSQSADGPNTDEVGGKRKSLCQEAECNGFDFEAYRTWTRQQIDADFWTAGDGVVIMANDKSRKE